MEEIGLLIARVTEARTAHSEKSRAFGEIVRRFQDMAFGCALAVLGDFHLAEDAAQEAFLVAWRNLDQLRKPEAFPGWFKRIVLSQCSRFTRIKRPELVPLDSVLDLPSAEPEPHEVLAQSQLKYCVMEAIQALPDAERMAVTLFYINEYSQNEIAAFLEVPLTTVKKRLFSARQKLRKTMLELVRDTLQAERPSRDAQFADMVTLFQEALESFVAKIKQDRSILAAVLFGSLSYDKVWKKSDIDIMLVGRDEKKPARHFSLVENGINIHAFMLPRSKFKQALEGSLQGAFFHSSFSKSTLLFTHDETLKEYYQDVQRMGSRDIEMQYLCSAQSALYTLAKAEKWFYVKKDLTYSYLWIMHTLENLAKIEVISHGEVLTREVMHQALQHNAPFFNQIYFDLTHQTKDEQAISNALKLLNDYLDARLYVLFRPILDYLEEAGGIRSTTELDAYFKPQTQLHSLGMIYEWL